MKRTILTAVCMILLGTAAYSNEVQGDPAAAFRKDYPAVSLESVEKTDIEGLYEVVAGGNVFYYHPKTGNVLFGEMITRNFTNITAERRNTIIAGRLKDLPLEKAVRIGTGRNVVIEFTDVDCPFCRKLEEFFDKRSDVTRFVFLFPIEGLHPESTKKSIAVLCSGDPSDAYKKAVKGIYDGKTIPACSDKKASALLDEHLEQGRKLGVQGTPALWINNVPVAGANIPLIERLLSSNKDHNLPRKEVKE